ncbi:vitamin K-dependent protein Z isoform X4 [Manis javanica]|uniref:vitamin K-dependent protein Z isoform X4 n=1 Tax=Manis javanica TaxID=9974 RepID=UPI003C6D3BF2|nr:Vitamin K-dependent protein Z [Manis javanica]
MAPCVRLLFILLLFLEPHRAASSVFVPASDANEVLVRWKRAGSYLLEELFEGNLEKECYEEICVYEEAREVFENDADTDGFWERYMGGSPCASRPCLNNGSCQDSVRSYTCSCPSGYEGRDCALAKNECHASRTDGCQHFCRPGKESYACSCAQGYRLGPDRKACVPHERCACGAPSPEGITAPLGGRRPLQAFPWQVKLTNSEGKDFCGGVIIQKNFVLTTAKCSLLHRNISVKTSSRRASADPLAIGVKGVHVHMRYEEETGDNDISLLELGRPIQCPDAGLPICVPEKDFAEHVLIPGTGGLLSGWTLHGPELGDVTTQLLVTLMDSEECGRALNATVTTRMYCDRGVAGGSLQWAGGSTVAREHAGTWFLTGILGAVPREEHAGAFLLTKVARYSLWFRQVMSNRAQPAE